MAFIHHSIWFSLVSSSMTSLFVAGSSNIRNSFISLLFAKLLILGMGVGVKAPTLTGGVA